MAKKKKNTLQLTDTQMTRSDYLKQKKLQSDTGTRMTKEDYENQRKNKLHTEPAAKSILPDNLLDNVLSYMSKWNENRIAQQKTASLKQKAQDARYSPEGDQSWQVYAAKQIYDTPGSLERLQRQEADRAYRSSPTYQIKQLAQDATYAGRPELAYASKMIRDSGMDDEKKTEAWNRFLSNEYGIRTTAPQQETKKEGYSLGEILSGAWKPSADEQRRMTEFGINSGWYDKGDREMYMSDEGLARRKTQLTGLLTGEQKNLEDLNNYINNFDGAAGWKSLFDYLYQWDMDNEIKIRKNYEADPDSVKLDQLETANKTYRRLYEERADKQYQAYAIAENYAINHPQGLPEATDEASLLERRRTAFDDVFGAGEYDRRMSIFYNDDERNRFNQSIDEAINGMKRREMNTTELIDEQDRISRKIEAYQKELNETEAEYGRRTQLKSYADQISSYTQATGIYDQSLIPEPETVDTERASFTAPRGTEMEKIYFWANNKGTITNGPETEKNAKLAQFMSDEMVLNFNKMFEFDRQTGKNLAGAYFEALKPYLQSELTMLEENTYREQANLPGLGILARAVTYPAMAAGGAIATAGSLAAALGLESAQDTTSDWYAPIKFAQTTRQEQNENISQWAADKLNEWGRNVDWLSDDIGTWSKDKINFLLNVGDSVLDNVFAMGTAKALSKADNLYAAKNLIQLIMSGEATGSEFIKQMESGRNPGEAALRAVGSGIVEWVTEEASWEALLKPDVKSMLGKKKDILAYLAKATYAEGSEEVHADLLNMGLDWLLSKVNGHETEIQERVTKLINSGVDPKVARKQVLMDKIGDIALSGLAGAISGAMLAGGRIIANASSMAHTGRTISSNNNAYDGKTGQERLVDLAMGMKQGSVSQEIATELQERLKSGKKISSYDIGKLAQAIAEETGETQQQVIKDTVQRVINGQLVDVGIDKDRAEVLAGIITESTMNDGKLTNDQRKALARDGRALQVWMEYNSDKYSDSEKIKNLNKEIRKSTAEQRGIMAELGDLTDKYSAERLEAIKKIAGNKMATDTDIRQAEESGEKRVEGPSGILYRGKFGKVVGTTPAQTEDGKNTIKYLVDMGDGKTVEADAHEVASTDPATAILMQNIERAPGAYDTEYTDKILKSLKGKSATANLKTVLAAETLRFEAFTAKDKASDVGIDESDADELFEHSRKSLIEKRRQEVEQGRKRANKPGFGTATFKGVRVGTEAYQKLVKEMGLSKETRNRMGAWAEVAKIAGIDLVFVDNSDIEEAQKSEKDSFKGEAKGKYGAQRGNTIELNIEGKEYVVDKETGKGRFTEDTHNIGLSFSHEMIHWLMTKSMDGYNNLVKYVMDKKRITMKQAELDARLIEIMDKRGVDLKGAVDEMTADGLDHILANEDVLKHIQETNESLFKDIKSAVRNIVLRVKNAIKGMSEQKSKDTLELTEPELKKVAGLFNIAWDEATGLISEKATDQSRVNDAAKEVVRKSVAELGTEYRAAVKDDDTDKAQAIVDETARRNGYDTEKAYHGTMKFGFSVFDTDKGSGNIFVAYSPKVAQTYTKNGQVRTLGSRKAGDVRTMTDSQLKDTAKKIVTEQGGDPVIDWEVTPEGKFRMWYIDENNTVERKRGRKAYIDWARVAVEGIVNEKFALLGENEGVYALYTRPGNQFVVDAKRARSSGIEITGQQINEDTGKTIFDTTEIADWARTHGYDSVRINNVYGPHRYNQNIDVKAEMESLYTDFGIFFNPQDVKSADAIVYDNDGEVIPIEERFDPAEKDIRLSQADTTNWKTYREENGELYSRDGNGNKVKLEGLDREYVEAWYRGDFNRMEEILMDRIRERGAIPFKTPESYSSPNHQWIANAIKRGDMNAIRTAAQEMATMVPDNAVLVPMPNRHGVVQNNTDTMILAREIAKIKGVPVINALQGAERESRQADKLKPKNQQMTAEDLGFRQIAEIPEGKIPYIVDNVIASGLTAQAAHRALGNNGVTLAYAKGTRSANDGLKRANVTFYDTNKQYGQYLIPLSERIDMEKTGYPGVKFSQAEITNGIRKGMTDSERYNLIKGTQVLIPNAEGKLTQQEINRFKNITDKKIADKELKNLANKYGIINKTLKNNYMQDKKVLFSNRNMHESVSKQDGGYINMAALIPVFEETFKTAVPFSVQGDRYYQIVDDREKLETFAELMGAFRYGDNIVPVKFDVKHAKGEGSDVLYVVATINKDAVVVAASLNNSLSAARASSVISIEDIIKHVNKEDMKLLTMIPAQFLNETQLEGKRKGLKKEGQYIREKAERARQKSNDPIVQYNANMTAERIREAINRYGSPTDADYSKAYMTYINPKTFVELNARDTEEIENTSRPINGSDLTGNHQTPFIKVDMDTGEIVGHEGRHRMQALADAGVEKVAVLVVPNSEKGKNNRQTIKSFEVTGENDTKATLENLIPVNQKHRKELIDTYSKSDNWFRYSTAELEDEYDQNEQNLYQATQDAQGKVNSLRKQFMDMKPEADKWVERLTEAKENGTLDEVMAEYKEWEKGYIRLRDEMQEANQANKKAQQDYEDYLEERDVTEERRKIEESGLTEPEYRRKLAVKNFGYTSDFREAGYLLPNGKMLNFSGNGKQHTGTRDQDHRAIETIYASREYKRGAAMLAFMKDGNIRMHPGTPGIDIISTVEPTSAQYNAIRDMVRRFAKEEYFNVDFTDEDGYNAGSLEYDGRINPDKIVNDIKTFYKTGEIPEQSVISQFHYSMAEMDDEYESAVRNKNVDRQQRLVDEAAERAMPDSKVRSKNGKLLKVYHGTPAVFNEFLRDKIGSTGRFEGSGFNFTPSEMRASSYGGNVLSGYLNITNPLSSDKKTISVAKLAQLIREADPTGDYIISDYARNSNDYGKDSFIRRESMTAARLVWEASENDVDIYSFISAADPDAENLIKVFESLGYDGLIHYDDNGNIKTAVAFKSEQFKRADPAIYDNGKLIKLNQRFNMQEPDIRYSAAEIAEEGDSVTLPKLDIRRDVYFNGTEQEIDDAEQAMKQRKAEMKAIIEADDFTAMLLRDKEGGRYEILHPSTRPGVKYQLTYYAPDDIPSMHENYGRTDAENPVDEAIHSMDELYNHYANESLSKALNISVLRDGGNQRTRFSQAEESMDVNAWLSERSPSSFRTEDERVMWQAWKDLRISMSLSLHRQQLYKDEIRKLEQKGELTAEEREQLRALKNKLEVQRVKMDRMEKEMLRITSNEGWAAMMRQTNMVLSDFIAGKTQEQVTAAVDTMTNEVQRIEKQIAKQEKDLEELAKTNPVRTAKGILSSKGLDRTVDVLKTQYNTTMSKSEIGSRLAEIVLKQAQGEDATEDIEALASDIINNQKGYTSEYAEEELGNLRGLTIQIGPGQQKELKANHQTLKSIRDRTRGSGIKFVYGDTSSLDTNFDEIGNLVPTLREKLGNEKASLEAFVQHVESLLAQRKGSAEESGIDQGEVEAFVRASANLMLTEGAGGVSREVLLKKIKNRAGNIGKALETVRGVRETLAGVKESSEKAKSWAGMLKQDMDTALNYYNRMAKLAAQQERKAVRQQLIEQLKSENTRKLLEQQAKYKEMMQKDRKARELHDENLRIRSRIDTNVKRISRLMTEETDTKNIPEEAKPLARLLVKMIVEHDENFRKVTLSNKNQLEKARQSLNGWQNIYGDFEDKDLDWLIIGEGDDADYDVHDRVVQDLMDIERGLLEYRQADGQGNVTLQDRRNALKKVSDAISEIYDVIKRRQTAEINGQRMIIDELAMNARDEMANSRFKGEWTGWLGKKIGALRSAVVYGNMTPEYFFKNLKNKTLSGLYEEYHRAENRNGLELVKAKKALAKIAEDTGYSTWDLETRHAVKLENGGEVKLTLGEMMSIYAIWQREAMNQTELNGPEKSFHLEKGGFYVEEEEKKGVAGREKQSQRAHRLTQNDINTIASMMTPEQMDYLTRMVQYLTKDIGELGNEASMRMYGIRKFNEQWYFPMEVWRGVLSSKSNAGAQQSTQNRIAHGSQTKRRRNNANNALVIRDFTETVAKHIVAQINYNTFAPAIEYMQRVMNTQLKEGNNADDMTSRNLWTYFQEAYGKDAKKYFDTFQKDINGGATQIERGIYDKLLSTFRKSAVAGSLSVALQQPLSYIRAAIDIDPKYLASALSPKNSYLLNNKGYKTLEDEMLTHSGVAVLKQMGKFDMGIGASAQQYLLPDAKQTKGQAAYKWVSDKSTALPEVMDRVTWVRLWAAAKAEQAALNPDMKTDSKEFLQKVADRFNEVIRTTQVYDSTLVRSENMRSKSPIKKMFTSFMAEPTLTANVLADSVLNANEQGGKARLTKAAAAFLLSAIGQALVKGLMSAGRNPDKKKTWDENAAYRFMYSFITEINPLGLIPGYSDAIKLIKEGELSDDATTVIGKIFSAVQKGSKLLGGSEDVYRDLEDSVGVITQLFTNVPVKNLLRDARAMYNFFSQPYAQRPNNPGVLKYQLFDQAMTADNLLGALNVRSGNAIWNTNNSAYYGRLYEAKKAGNEQDEQDITDYLTLAKGVEEKTIISSLKGLTKKDTKLEPEKRIEELRELGMKDSDIAQWIGEEYGSGRLTKDEAVRLYVLANPKKTENDAYFYFEQADWEKQTGKNINTSDYFRMDQAIESRDMAEFKSAVKELTEHGHKEKDVLEKATEKVTDKYKDGDIDRKEAEKLIKQMNEKLTDDDVWWMFDRIDYKKEKKLSDSVSGNYYRLYDAIEENKSDDIRSAVQLMLNHGMKKENIKKQITSKYKKQYLEASGNEKIKLKDALTKAYKAVGMTATEAQETINKWKKTK